MFKTTRRDASTGTDLVLTQPGSCAPGCLVKVLSGVLWGAPLQRSCAEVLRGCDTLTKPTNMDPCGAGLARRPCATKALSRNGRPCATKALHKTFARQKPYAGLVRFLGLLSKVLCGPRADFFRWIFYSVQHRNMSIKLCDMTI